MHELRGKGEDADGERQDQPVDEDEEDVLDALQEVEHGALVIALRHYGESEAEESGDNEDTEDIPGGERRHEIVRDHADEVLHVGLFRHSAVRELGSPRDLRRDIGGREDEEEREADGGREYGREECVEHRVAEDGAGVRPLPELRERCYERERYYRYRDELEEPREDKRYEVHRLDKGAVLDKAEGRAEHKAGAVEYRGARPCLLFQIIIRQFCHDFAPCL